MPVAKTPPGSQSRAARLLLLVAVVGVVTVVGWRAWVYAVARLNLSEGKSLLARDKPDEARPRLDACLTVLPTNGEAHYYAARAARRTGDLDAARRHLVEAAANGWAAEDVARERSLMRVQEGDFEAEEPYLTKLVLESHPDTAAVLEVLTPLYYSRYQLEEARHCADKWVELRPGSAKAWNYRGEILGRLRHFEKAITSFREAIRLDPSFRAARTKLADLMLDQRQSPAQVEEVIAPLLRETPDDPYTQRLLIRCREAQGRLSEAIQLADVLLRRDPNSATSLQLRGRLELESGRAAAAVPFLRDAVKYAPHDIDAHYTLWRCLNETGPAEEAKAVEARFKKLQEELQRLRDLARRIVASPHDADLRREAGEIAIRNGLESDGIRWLASALQERPDDPRTHQVLSEYYSRTNRPDLAEYHKSRITPGGQGSARPMDLSAPPGRS